MSKENMIKALKCIASQDAEDDCYADRYNAHLICDQHDKKDKVRRKSNDLWGSYRKYNKLPLPSK